MAGLKIEKWVKINPNGNELILTQKYKIQLERQKRDTGQPYLLI